MELSLDLRNLCRAKMGLTHCALSAPLGIQSILAKILLVRFLTVVDMEVLVHCVNS